ncbi:MAG: C-terminal binding protein [Planctomycetaceae bacterium]
MARPKVIITDFISGGLDREQRILGDLADIIALKADYEEEMVGRIEEADMLLVYHTIKITKKTIDNLRHCKLIVRCGVGYDNVDGKAARAKGITLCNVPDYGTEEVADSAIAMALALSRGVNFQNRRLQSERNDWTHLHVMPILRLRGRKFAIVGLGRIGTAAALRAKALGMDVVFYDPYVKDGVDKALGIRRAESLEELLKDAHIVSTHCYLNEETKHIMNRQTIALMPRGSYLVNTARGGVVDVAAVAEAIGSGHLAGAGIDVLESEPPEPDNPLVKAWRDPSHPAHDRVILNPHAAFYSEEGLEEMRVKGSENCRRVLLGQAPRNVVN